MAAMSMVHDGMGSVKGLKVVNCIPGGAVSYSLVVTLLL